MSRKLRSTLPESPDNLLPRVPDKVTVASHDCKMKVQQKVNYDRRHGVRPLQPLSPGNPVWITDRAEEGKVINTAGSRSYYARTEQGVYQRNRQHLICLPEGENEYSDSDAIPDNLGDGTTAEPAEPANHPSIESPGTDSPQNGSFRQLPRRSERLHKPRVFHEPTW